LRRATQLGCAAFSAQESPVWALSCDPNAAFPQN
jgi:hypothetical protein